MTLRPSGKVPTVSPPLERFALLVATTDGSLRSKLLAQPTRNNKRTILNVFIHSPFQGQLQSTEPFQGQLQSTETEVQHL